MRLIVGLGNSGSRYAQTRHNVGFLVIDQLLESLGQKSPKSVSNLCSFSECEVLGECVVIAKPNTFMNESGLAVQKLVSQFELIPAFCLVVLDDAALPIGKIRFRPKGSSGGHNGLESVIQTLQTEDIPRLRVGIGTPTKEELGEALSDYVLDHFTKAEFEALKPQIVRSEQACLEWLKTTNEQVMQRFNN